MKKILTSICCVLATVLAADAATQIIRRAPAPRTAPVRMLSPTTTRAATAVRVAGSNATRAASPTRSINPSRSRLSSSSFLGNTGRAPGGDTGGGSGPSTGIPPDVDLSNYVTIENLDNTTTELTDKIEEVVDMIDELDSSGTQGPKGDDGEDGESAYELAVKNGFAGTESEWLESLGGDGGNVDLTNYATKTEVTTAAAGALTDANEYTDEALTNLVAGEINLTGYATTSYVDDAIAEIGLGTGETLATVAKTGSYNDLLDKPTIPTPAEITQQIENAVDEIDVDLTGYATEAYVNTANATKEGKIVGGSANVGKFLVGTTTGWAWIDLDLSALDPGMPEACDPACGSGEICESGICVIDIPDDEFPDPPGDGEYEFPPFG